MIWITKNDFDANALWYDTLLCSLLLLFCLTQRQTLWSDAMLLMKTVFGVLYIDEKRGCDAFSSCGWMDEKKK